MSDRSILVINSGSSSLKVGLYTEREGELELVLDGLADGIGIESGTLKLTGRDGSVLRSETHRFATQAEALRDAAGWMTQFSQSRPSAIGHRVVHGGPKLITHQRITPGMLDELKCCVHFAPLHIPAALDVIAEAERSFPGVAQFACFDTAFHTTMPATASRFSLPRALFDEGIRRYGFHGLSYESIVRHLSSHLPSRTVVAHLGSGASLAALKDGRSIDTSMGLTPTGGIPMATRSGDLDPGVLLYLLREKHMNADSLEDLLNHGSGVKALSGGSSDMRDLEIATNAGDQKAALAIEVFCIAVRKMIAAYAAVLGGLDMLVFSGGIGEHSALVRRNVCSGLGFFGVHLDRTKNELNASTISDESSSIRVLVVRSEEDLQIARHCRDLMKDMEGGFIAGNS